MNSSLLMEIVKKLYPNLVSFFVALALITLLFVIWYDPFVLVGPELLKNPNFSQEFSSWKYSNQPDNVAIEDQGIVKLHSTNPKSNTAITQIISDPVRFKFPQLAPLVLPRLRPQFQRRAFPVTTH